MIAPPTTALWTALKDRKHSAADNKSDASSLVLSKQVIGNTYVTIEYTLDD